MAVRFICACLTIFVTTSASARAIKAKNTRSQPQQRTVAPAQPIERSNWEVRTAPVALLADWLTLDLAYRIDEHWATGPALVSFSCSGRGNMFLPCWNGSGLGWQGTYYVNPVIEDGIYTSLHAYRDSFEAYGHDQMLSHDKVEGLRAQAMLGYMVHGALHSIWHMGAGWEVRSYKTRKIYDAPTDNTDTGSESRLWNNPMLEIKLGFAF